MLRLDNNNVCIKNNKLQKYFILVRSNHIHTGISLKYIYMTYKYNKYMYCTI